MSDTENIRFTTKEKVLAAFELADIKVCDIWKTENLYWPDCEEYEQIKIDNPWWLILTTKGIVEIRRRERVYEITWNHSSFNEIVTDDDVTKDTKLIHAWGSAKLIEYLTLLNKS